MNLLLRKSKIAEQQFYESTICSMAKLHRCSSGSAMAKAKTVQFRAQVPQDIDFLIRAIAPFKNAGKDWTLSDIVVEALMERLRKPENRELVESHNILEGLERRGLATNVYDDIP
jgi:hypothetical protein